MLYIENLTYYYIITLTLYIVLFDNLY